MMRGTPKMRLTMAILSPMFLLLCVVAIWSEETQPWMAYQEEFKRLYVERATAKLEDAKARNDAQEQARWQRVIDEVSQARPEIGQIYLEDLKVADRCVTCHRAIDNPLFTDAPEPFRTHPGDVLKHHDPNTFACTPCHQGQGAATTVDAAHRGEAHWPKPLLPAAYQRAACAHCHEVTHGLAGAELASRGADLFMEKGCYGCHDVKGIRDLPKFAPPLTSLKSKLKDPAAWVYAWVKDPSEVSEATAMPNFELSEADAGKIAAFVLSVSKQERYDPVPLEAASAERGEHLFTERGCHGCHAVKAEERSVSPRVPHLAGVGAKVTAEWLDRWLADPKAYNRDTAMPKVKLTDEERRDVVVYLLTLQRSKPLPPVPDLGAFKPEEGKQLVKQYECFGCHSIEGFEQARPAVPDLSEFARKPVDQPDFADATDVPRTKWDWLARKLNEPRAYETDKIKLYMPVMSLDDREMQAIITYVLALDSPELPARYSVRASDGRRALRELSWMIGRLSCNGCHPLNDREPRIAQFLERRTLVPPVLDGVGARLQGQYLYEFLLEPTQVRPWFKMQMPDFGFTEEQAQTLVAGFAAAENVTNPYTYFARTKIDEEHFQRGIRRFTHYKCVQCHPTSIDQGLPPDLDPDDLSINLMLTKARLRPEWIKDFMARPKDIAGIHTRMPTVFYTVDGVPKVEHPEKDIEDITMYLMGMTEPPEVTLEAQAQAREKEEKEAIDWTRYEY
jgi:mono/diheme cytochrome c family protein